MLRRLSLSAAVAALAVPAVLARAAQAGNGRGPGDDAGAQAQVRKQQPLVHRKAELSRRASRAKAADEAPLAITIDQLTPSTIPAQGVIRVSGTVTNTDSATWSTINVRPFI